jgi:hypothetical protein
MHCLGPTCCAHLTPLPHGALIVPQPGISTIFSLHKVFWLPGISCPSLTLPKTPLLILPISRQCSCCPWVLLSAQPLGSQKACSRCIYSSVFFSMWTMSSSHIGVTLFISVATLLGECLTQNCYSKNDYAWMNGSKCLAPNSLQMCSPHVRATPGYVPEFSKLTYSKLSLSSSPHTSAPLSDFFSV